ncbi:MAG: LysR family transcriptional regulator [Dyella sp.]
MKSSRGLPSLNALRAFEAAARHTRVSRAAIELHVTHGAISRHIRALEQDLGLELFKRQGRGLTLTDAGRRLRDAAAAAFEPLRATCQQLRQHGRPEALVLGCPGSVLARWVIPRMDALARDLPQLSLHMSALDQTPDPDMQGLDAVLLVAELPLSGNWQVHTLAAEMIGPILSPRHAAAERLCHAPPATLLDEALLHTASRPQAWTAWAQAQSLPADRLRLGQGFDHLYYLLEAAVAGLGVAIAPQQLVADDIAGGRLLAPWGFSATAAHWLLCAPRRAADPRLTQLADWLRAQLQAA